jgi:hypothetical protein
MAKTQANQENQTKQVNQGANDGRLALLNDEQREILMKGGKAKPDPETGHETISEAIQQDEHDGSPASGQKSDPPSSDASGPNADDELGARGGLMGGSSRGGSRRTVS